MCSLIREGIITWQKEDKLARVLTFISKSPGEGDIEVQNIMEKVKKDFSKTERKYAQAGDEGGQVCKQVYVSREKRNLGFAS